MVFTWLSATHTTLPSATASFDDKNCAGNIENNTWISEEVFFQAPGKTYQTTRHHYGCRIVFDPWGYCTLPLANRGADFRHRMYITQRENPPDS